MKRFWCFLAALMFALAGLTACVGPVPTSGTQPNGQTPSAAAGPGNPADSPDQPTAADSPASTPVQQSPSSQCSAGTQDNGQGSCLPCADYEGCFTDPTQMKFFYSKIIEWVRAFSQQTYADLPDPKQWLYVPTGATGKEGCTDQTGAQGSYDDESYEYCPADGIVYVGEQSMWGYYRKLGDAAPAVGIAHEWGHHVQAAVKLTVRDRSDVIKQENQADCVAGAWSAYLVDEKIMVEDDFADVGDLLVAIGSQEGPNRNHGTVQEREESFVKGLRGGMRACNDFFPDRPIIS